MSRDETLTVSCPQGHQLLAKPKSIGMTLPCPVCLSMVAIEPDRRDELSDTGVMRILGDFTPPVEPVLACELPPLRNCPICSLEVPDTSPVCQHCHCYVGPSPDYLRTMTQATNLKG